MRAAKFERVNSKPVKSLLRNLYSCLKLRQWLSLTVFRKLSSVSKCRYRIYFSLCKWDKFSNQVLTFTAVSLSAPCPIATRPWHNRRREPLDKSKLINWLTKYILLYTNCPRHRLKRVKTGGTLVVDLYHLPYKTWSVTAWLIICPFF